MDDDEREAITEARISGVSCRALAKAHQVSTADIEAAVDRRLDYELNNQQRLRLVKLSVERIMALMAPFYEMAVGGKGVCASERISAATLVVKCEERLGFLLGLDHPTQARVDVYAVEREREPSSHEEIRAAIMRVARGPNWQPPAANGDGNAVTVLSNSDDKPSP
jgi:hypothetical protein